MVKNILCSVFKFCVLCSTAENKNCLLLIRSEKIVCLSWESKKSLITKKTIAPPTYQMVRPLFCIFELFLVLLKFYVTDC